MPEHMKLIIITLIVLLLPSFLLAGSIYSPTPVIDAFDAAMFQSNALLTAAPDKDEWSDDIQTDQGGSRSVGEKSMFKAALYSALIPGGGEYYLGKRKKARFFFAVEAMTWASYIAFRVYGGWKEDDYINYASVHAGVQLENKSDEFRDMVSFYDNIELYNTGGRIIESGRDYYPDTPEYHWQWDSQESKSTYRDLKNSSREAYHRSEFVVGMAVLTRVISIIDAVRDTRRMNRRIDFSNTENDQKFKLTLSPLNSKTQLKLTLFTGM